MSNGKNPEGQRRPYVVPRASTWYVQKPASPGLKKEFAKRPKVTSRERGNETFMIELLINVPKTSL